MTSTPQTITIDAETTALTIYDSPLAPRPSQLAPRPSPLPPQSGLRTFTWSARTL